jgi:tRNA(Arg) A34 adenosine deaminase TadA
MNMNKTIQESLMQLAIAEARIAVQEGNYPFGAVVALQDGTLLARAHNTQNSDNDPTAHAEMNIIRSLAKNHPESEFSSFYLICNAESCSMCISAAIKAGMLHFVFGAPSEPHMEPYLTVSEVQKYCRQPLDVVCGVLADQCREQILAARREQGKLAQ